MRNVLPGSFEIREILVILIYGARGTLRDSWGARFYHSYVRAFELATNVIDHREFMNPEIYANRCGNVFSKH